MNPDTIDLFPHRHPLVSEAGRQTEAHAVIVRWQCHEKNLFSLIEEALTEAYEAGVRVGRADANRSQPHLYPSEDLVPSAEDLQRGVGL